MTPVEILNFWFGDSLTNQGRLHHYTSLWYRGEAGLDQAIATRFGAAITLAGEGAFDCWTVTPHGRLAVILLLDQFARNAFRGSAAAFRYERQAVHLARSGLQIGADGKLEQLEREFFYMPLLHSEQLEDQDLSVACFERLLEEASPALASHLSDMLAIARRYRAIIFRFGRFPHRNKRLRRRSRLSERCFLLHRWLRGASSHPLAYINVLLASRWR